MTKAQEQVLATLRAQDLVGRTFSAHDAFPGNTPQGSANRRILESLVREGILAHGVAPLGWAVSPGATEAIAAMQTSRENLEQANVRVTMATGRDGRTALESWLTEKGVNPTALYDVPQARWIAAEALEAKMITPEVHEKFHNEVLSILHDSRSGVQMKDLAKMQEKGPQWVTADTIEPSKNSRQPLYHFAPQMEKAVQRERQTSLGHKAEQHRGQEMGL